MQLKAEKKVAWSATKPQVDYSFDGVYLGPDPHGLGGFQAAVASSDSKPSRQAVRDLFMARKEDADPIGGLGHTRRPRT